jgi:hypothetical protein
MRMTGTQARSSLQGHAPCCLCSMVGEKWRKQVARKQAVATAAAAAADAEAGALDTMEVVEEGRQFAEHDEVMAMMQDEALWEEWGAENGGEVHALIDAMPAEEMRSGATLRQPWNGALWAQQLAMGKPATLLDP